MATMTRSRASARPLTRQLPLYLASRAAVLSLAAKRKTVHFPLVAPRHLSRDVVVALLCGGARRADADAAPWGRRAGAHRAAPYRRWRGGSTRWRRSARSPSCVFEPTRRLLGRAFNTLCDTADGMRSVRRAAAAMMHRQRRRALNAWRDGCASRERCLGLMHQGVAALVLLSAQVHNLRKQTHNLRKHYISRA